MKPLFDPSLISLDNAAEDFWQEYKRRTTRIVQPDELPEGHYWAPVPQYVAPNVKRRGLLIGMLAGAILWGVLGLIVWMVR